MSGRLTVGFISCAIPFHHEQHAGTTEDRLVMNHEETCISNSGFIIGYTIIDVLLNSNQYRWHNLISYVKLRIGNIDQSAP